VRTRYNVGVQPAVPPSGQQVELVHGDQWAVVTEVGAAIRVYRVAGEDVLDGFGLDEMSSAGRGQTLIPWPNRLAGGSYRFEGETYQLPLTEPAKHNAIHGLVRFANWTVAEQGSGHVVMAHRLHPQPGYPFVLDLRVTYQLGDGGLVVHLVATNRGVGPCPFGAGAHPYLRIGGGGIDALTLRAPGATWCPVDGEGIPVGRRPVDATANDFRTPRPIGDTRLDTAFTDLARDDDGHAVIDLADPEGARRVTLWLDDAYHYYMLFTGDSITDARRRRSLAVEPMTCAPDAFRSGDGLRILAPGAAFEATWGVTTTGFSG
jgi:aldose 1-epimerase